MSAARELLDSLGARSRPGIQQLYRALDLAEAHDAREVKPVAPERPLHERLRESIETFHARLPIAALDLWRSGVSRLAQLEHERNSPPRPGIQVQVADDLDVMSLGDLCARFNTQRTTIIRLTEESDVLTKKARRLDAIVGALRV